MGVARSAKPDEVQRAQHPKCFEKNNKDDDKSPYVNNANNGIFVSKKFRYKISINEYLQTKKITSKKTKKKILVVLLRAT